MTHLSLLDEPAIAQLDWRDFERHCAKVLEGNGYRVTGGVCFRSGGRKYQVDIIGVRLDRVLCVDCKAWLRGGGTWRSRRAAEAQRERSVGLRAHLAARSGRTGVDATFFPIIVTLKDEGMTIHDGTPIVPFQDLNGFLINFEYYESELGPAQLPGT